MPLAPLVSMVFQDVRHYVGLLRKNPGFTAVTVLTLTVGIGATTAMFSVVDSVLLRSLPYEESGRLVVVWETTPKRLRGFVSEANFLDWHDQNQAFEHLAALSFAAFNLSGSGLPERVDGIKSSWEVFELLRVRPLVGRSFVAADGRPGAPPVAIISYSLWQRRFGGDPKVVGQAVNVDGAPCTVVGVMPSHFRYFAAPDMWMPLAHNRAEASRDFRYMVVLGRLRPHTSLESARGEMAAIHRHLEAAYPESNRNRGTFVELMTVAAREGQTQGVLIVFGAVVFLLIIACVNVSNLLLASATVRRRELAVRASLGASPSRLVSQLLTESVFLALVAAGAGLVLAVALVQTVRGLIPANLASIFSEIAVNWRALAFTASLSLVTGVLFGSAPAWHVLRLDLNDILKEGGGLRSTSSRQVRFRSVLVVSQVALCLVLLVGTGLIVRSLGVLHGVDPGFRPARVLTMRLSMSDRTFPDGAAIGRFYRQALEGLAALPGVESASISLGLPLQDPQLAMRFHIAGRPQATPAEGASAVYEPVSSGYFGTLEIPLRAGRVFATADDENGPGVAIVNEAFVREYLPEWTVLGQRLLVKRLVPGKRQFGVAMPWEIVGVVGNVKLGSLSGRDTPIIYVPMLQSPWPGGSVALRTLVEPLTVVEGVRSAIARINPDTPVSAVKTMDEIAIESTSQTRSRAWLVSSFALLALVLAALGVYGVTSYSVAQRTRDFGVRVVLGATAEELLRLTLREGALLTAAGVVIGTGAALALTRLVTGLLFGTRPTDPWVFAMAPLVLALVALPAILVPARRAARIDPVETLRAG